MRVDILQSGGLGNFITATPAIRAISEKMDYPVQVYFKSKTCAEMVQDAPFIEPMKKRPTHPLFSTGEHQDGVSDYRYFFEKYAVKKLGYPGKMPDAYVDAPPIVSHRRYFAMVRGCASNPIQEALKVPFETTYQIIADLMRSRGLHVVLAGNKADRDRWSELPDGVEDCTGDNIRHALALLNEAEGVIANDSGLCYAASALKKPLFIAWHKQPIENLERVRVPDPYGNVAYGLDDLWLVKFDRWIDQRMVPA